MHALCAIDCSRVTPSDCVQELQHNPPVLARCRLCLEALSMSPIAQMAERRKECIVGIHGRLEVLRPVGGKREGEVH